MRRILTSYGIWIFITCNCTLVQAQEKPLEVPGNLHSCIHYALDHNYNFRISEFNIQKGTVTVRQQKTSLLPDINAFALYNWYWGGLPTYIFPEKEGSILSGGQSTGPYAVPLGLPQNLFMGLKFNQRIYDQRFFLGKQGKETLLNLNEGRAEAEKNKVIHDVAKAYYEILDLQTREEIVAFNSSRLNTYIEIMQSRVNNQMAAPMDLEKLQLEMAKVKLARSKLESGLELKKKAFEFLIGLSVDTTFDISPSPEDTLMLTHTDTLVSPETSIQFRLLQSMESLNEIQKKETKASYLPSLDLYGNFLWQAQSENLNFFNGQPFYNISNLGLKLDIPIYHGSDKSYHLQQLQLDKDVIDVQKEMLQQAEKLKKNSNQENLQLLINQYEQQANVVSYAGKYYDQVYSKFKQGLAPVQDLLSAHADWIDARSDLSSLRYQVKLAELEYLTASGNLGLIYQ